MKLSYVKKANSLAELKRQYKKASLEDHEDFQDEHIFDDDAILTPSGRLGGKVSLSIEGKHIGEFPDEEHAERALVQWISKHKVNPSVWWVDDHGGVSPYKVSKQNSKKIEQVMNAKALRKAADCLIKLAYYTRKTVYNGDPFWMTAKYEGVCRGCKCEIKKGDDMWYYPKGKVTYCKKCCAYEEHDFLSRIHDEELMSGEDNWR